MIVLTWTFKKNGNSILIQAETLEYALFWKLAFQILQSKVLDSIFFLLVYAY